MRLVRPVNARQTKARLEEQGKKARWNHLCPSCFLLGNYLGSDMYYCVAKRCIELVDKFASTHHASDGEYADPGSKVRVAFLIAVDLGFMKRDPIPEEEKVDLEYCECCKKHFANSVGLTWVDSYTHYGRKTGHPDPNRKLLLCGPCADQYATDMQQRWQDYHDSQRY